MESAGTGVLSPFAAFAGQAAASAAAAMFTAIVIDPQSTLAAMRPVVVIFAAALILGTAKAAATTDGFVGTVSLVRAADLRLSYRGGCPVGPAQLRLVRVSYRGFDGRVHLGSLVVSSRVTRDVVNVFRRLYKAHFPIRHMTPVSAYGGSDDASMAADNTSAFNCRRAVGSASAGWSQHAYGTAIDVNPVENPYVLGSRVLPPAGRRYLDRTVFRRGMAVEGGVLVRAFAAVGWKWGGRWSSPDYQHFSVSGR